MILNDRTYRRYSSPYHCEKQNKSHVIAFIFLFFFAIAGSYYDCTPA